jgi:RNA polymerase sigma factor (sigma-70 family)
MNGLREHILSHIDAAYNLARWLTRNDQDAKDAVQESFLRALKYGDSLKGEDPKPWFLKIIRNTCYTLIKRQKNPQFFISFDEEIHGANEKSENPELQLIRSADITLVRAALESLAVEYREVLILRELENLSYEEIAKIVDIPLGTVMSRISRGRVKLSELLKPTEIGRRIENENQ